MAIQAFAIRPTVRPDRNTAATQLVCRWTLADAVRATDRVVPFKRPRKSERHGSR